MRCDRCGRDAVVFQRYSGLHLCGDHFQGDLVARAKRTIRARGWIRTGDRIAVALSGGVSGTSLLHFLSAHFGMRRDLTLVAISVDEGSGSRRDTDRAERVARGMGIEWAGTSFSEEFGDIPDPGPGLLPGSCRDLLRGHALASLAGRMGATKLALGTTLDDRARSVLLAVLRGETTGLLARHTHAVGGIPAIMPFERIPLEEVALYARLNIPDCDQGPVMPASGPQETGEGRILDEYAHRHPAAPFSLANLGAALAGEGVPRPGTPARCESCREPCAGGCPARRILDQVAGRG